ncbi:MAG: metal-dependent transcriptional regulator [Candidatus Hydrogenedentes bacterium]|nr:metal-dependent transcriptional regulator [Candidatus Hydrogenedentota bacterium]
MADKNRSRQKKPPQVRKPTTHRAAGDEGARAASPNLEQYVETIAHLLTIDKVCTVSEIAEVAQVTRPAASRAVRELVDKDLAVHKAYGYVDLTDDGHSLANRLSLRHEHLYCFLKEVLGYDDRAADAEACLLEHHVSDDFVERLSAVTEIFRQREDLAGTLNRGRS